MCLQLHFQNGSVGNEEFSAASVLARLGVAVDPHGTFVRERPASLLSGGIVVNHKENVMDEPKEEDEKKTTEVYLLPVVVSVMFILSLLIAVL